jgi:anti-sigma factor RsiW
MALVDGGLAPLEAARDRGHLEACAPCRAELESEERLLVLVRRTAAPDLDADAERVVSAVLDELGARRVPRVARARAAAAALSAVAAGILLALVLRSGGAPAHVDLASLDALLARLPSLSEALRGLGQLSNLGS